MTFGFLRPHLRLLGLPPTRLWVVPAILAVLTLAACGEQALSSYPVTPVEPDSSGGKVAPDFAITVYQGEDVLGGNEVRFADLLAQGKPVVLNFWAGACPPCRVEMPDLEEVYETYKDRILLFGLDVGPFVRLGSREDGKALLGELGISFPAGTTFDGEVIEKFGVVGMPTTYFIRPNGEIARTWTGALNKGKLTDLVEDLLKEGEVETQE